jgi:F420-0:gamma-glutamyl ligase
MNIQCIPIKTRVLKPPKDNIYDVLKKSLPKLRNGDILCITSKILAIHQGRCISKNQITNKDILIEQEADVFLPRHQVPGGKMMLTIKDHTLIGSAGIDESNANDHYILWPRQTNRFLKEIWLYLRHRFNLKQLGIMSTDSASRPLRRGVIGIATASPRRH